VLFLDGFVDHFTGPVASPREAMVLSRRGRELLEPRRIQLLQAGEQLAAQAWLALRARGGQQGVLAELGAVSAAETPPRACRITRSTVGKSPAPIRPGNQLTRPARPAGSSRPQTPACKTPTGPEPAAMGLQQAATDHGSRRRVRASADLISAVSVAPGLRLNPCAWDPILKWQGPRGHRRRAKFSGATGGVHGQWGRGSCAGAASFFTPGDRVTFGATNLEVPAST